MAQPSFSPRDLVIHTGQASSLIADLSRQVEANRHLLNHWRIDPRQDKGLLPAIRHNDWRVWERQEQRRRWNPWHREQSVWMTSQAMLSPLLLDGGIQRVGHQLEDLGFRLVIVVHLLDGEELMARDYSRDVLALRWGGSYADFVATRLQRHPLRYHVDRLFMPLLERCGALGVRFVLHVPQKASAPEPPWPALLEMMRTGHPVQPLQWLPQEQASSQASLRQLQLSRLVLQKLGKPPLAAQRKQLAGLIRKAMGQDASTTEQANHPWAPLLMPSAALPASIGIAQQRLARKAWGREWPRAASDQTSQVSLDGLESICEGVIRAASGLTSRRNCNG